MEYQKPQLAEGDTVGSVVLGLAKEVGQFDSDPPISGVSLPTSDFGALGLDE